MRSALLITVVTWIGLLSVDAQNSSPASTRSPSHKIHFTSGSDGQAVAVIDNQNQPTVDSLKTYIRALPTGSTVVLKYPPEKLTSNNPFLTAIPDLKKI